jgi:hypothetical protein
MNSKSDIGHFSADNYGDRMTRKAAPSGTRTKFLAVNENRATAWMPTIEDFKDDRWEEIYEGAAEFIETKILKDTSTAVSSRGSSDVDEVQMFDSVILLSD